MHTVILFVTVKYCVKTAKHSTLIKHKYENVKKITHIIKYRKILSLFKVKHYTEIPKSLPDWESYTEFVISFKVLVYSESGICINNIPNLLMKV